MYNQEVKFVLEIGCHHLFRKYCERITSSYLCCNHVTYFSLRTQETSTLGTKFSKTTFLKIFEKSKHLLSSWKVQLMDFDRSFKKLLRFWNTFLNFFPCTIEFTIQMHGRKLNETITKEKSHVRNSDFF